MGTETKVDWAVVKTAAEKRLTKSALDWSSIMTNIKNHITKNPGLYRNLAIGGGIGALTGGLFGGLKGALGGGVLGLGLGYGSNYLQDMLTAKAKASPITPAMNALSRQIRDMDIDNKLRSGRIRQDYTDTAYPGWAANFMHNSVGPDVAAYNILNPVMKAGPYNMQ